jgi:hypothetical protein
LSFGRYDIAGFHQLLQVAQVLFHLLSRLLAEQPGDLGTEHTARRRSCRISPHPNIATITPNKPTAASSTLAHCLFFAEICRRTMTASNAYAKPLARIIHRTRQTPHTV